MDITYCNDKCPIGRAARDEFLALNNSAFDAAFDFRRFVDSCVETCPYKDMHAPQCEEDISHEGI